MPPLLAAAARQQGDRLPVWFMRQAGRALPEYHRARDGVGMLEACARPDLVTEITLQPVRRYGVDGAVVYSDIVVPLRAVGVDLDLVPGTGPVIADPIRDRAGLDRLRPLDPASVDFIAEAIRQLVAELGEQTPVIGFAGAPFTLASYLVEGGPSRDYARTKALMLADPQLWDDLCSRLADIAAEFLAVQIGAGARIVQLFDSWAGSLAPADYRQQVQPHSARVLSRVRELGVPSIHFGVGTGELLPAMAEAGPDVVGADWRVPLAEASRRIGPDHAVQGNLDPALLTAPWPVLADRVRDVIRSGAQAPGHIFNLGHGVPPTTDPDVLTRIVELVHTEGPALRAEVAR
ncbi:uroporphyrinogen decarboxylase [Microlunatus soli]|uniref:Uroporphyrinogen decarboxylase n=1 Tax=Microlunatus soli TaxID=630515 RepID=A0A1H2ARE3_9ACTN|nr:uroporphyrinogen decarboxylase [Microlunatus soli]